MSFDKIIVLDDEQIIRKSLEQQLRKKRYSVASAGTLAEAQALIGKDKFDLMFVDIRLPDGDGTELLDLFQDNPDAPMVIMMTGYSVDEMVHKAIEEKASEIIYKPFEIDKVLSLISKAT